jgi:hypothetical protein
MPIAGFVGDHPLVTLVAVVVVVVLIAVVGFMTVGLRRLEQQAPDPETPEEKRIRLANRKWWARLWLFPPGWPWR